MKNKALKYTIVYILIALFISLVYYITLPPLNPLSTSFWIFLAFVLALLLLPVCVRTEKEGEKETKKAAHSPFAPNYHGKKIRLRPVLFIALLPIAAIILGSIISSTFFNATKYANVIDVTEAVFREDMPETEMVTNIALMDSNTAAIVGSRTLGSLSHVVSQYEVSSHYTQINYQGTPKKVANLEYAGFFKWIGNRENGIPGYVMVDPVNNTAEYKELEKPIVYSESGYFGDNLMRKLRFSYPTKIFGDYKYEIDDEGNPVYIVPCMTPKVFPFGAYDVEEVIIFDPVTGDSQIYAVNETPSWIDNAYDGNLATEKYNWKGMYSGGYWNSVIGNRDCKVTTDDFGYIIIGDDVWYFTGVTSVNSDQSNIGFIISNARTGEYKFYPVIGAEEHSAMNAAQGEVQEKGYTASFPALINVEGEATYIMVLKDAGGLVKLYALVNVEQYNIVATGETQKIAMQAYKQLLVQEGILSPEDIEGDMEEEQPPVPDEDVFTAEITLDKIQLITMDGESYVCFTATLPEESERSLFLLPVKKDLGVLLLEEGAKLTVTYTADTKEGIYHIRSFTVK